MIALVIGIGVTLGGIALGLGLFVLGRPATTQHGMPRGHAMHQKPIKPQTVQAHFRR